MKNAYPELLRIFLETLHERYEFSHLPPMDVHSRACTGDTPLIMAAFWGDLRAARALLKHGADPNVKGEDFSTALHAAASQGHYEIAALLLAHGASREAADTGRRTARDLAEMKNNAEMVRLLTKPVFPQTLS